MTHHRGLIITLVIAVVVAGVGIGVMALATNDTDESVQEELAPGSVSRHLAGDPSPNGQFQSMTVALYCAQIGRVPCRGKVTPLWDSWNNCVEDNYTREKTFATNSTGQWSSTLGVTDKCFLEHSQMHWRVARDNGSYADVELHVDAGSAHVHPECGATSGRVNCRAERAGGGNPERIVVELCEVNACFG